MGLSDHFNYGGTAPDVRCDVCSVNFTPSPDRICGACRRDLACQPPMQLWTSTVRYDGQDKLDVTRKGNDPAGVIFAPSTSLLGRYHPAWGGQAQTADSWASFVVDYTAEMRRSFVEYRAEWVKAVSRHASLTLCCFERSGEDCHRRVLAPLLVAVAKKLGIGVEYRGEREGDIRQVGLAL